MPAAEDSPPPALRRPPGAAKAVDAQLVDLGAGALLRKVPQGWRLEQAAESVVFGAGEFDISTVAGAWRAMPMLRGAAPATGEGLLTLAETGDVTVSLGVSPLD